VLLLLLLLLAMHRGLGEGARGFLGGESLGANIAAKQRLWIRRWIRRCVSANMHSDHEPQDSA